MTFPFCQLRILVAESDVSVRKQMAYTLNQMGMAVVFAGDGKQALARFTSEHFDLIFMGLALPKLDGFAATAAIRHHENSFDNRVPIIAMTALRNSSERERCLTVGMDSYMAKPANSGQIQIALLAFTNPESLQSPTSPPKWTRLKALERVGGDENLLAELIAIFTSENSRFLAEIDRALVECKPELLHQSATDLQEQLDYMGAGDVCETARRLAVIANQPAFLETSELTALLRSQLFATRLAMSKN
jgi:two-component system, sensor histidine kinase and response regulator